MNKMFIGCKDVFVTRLGQYESRRKLAGAVNGRVQTEPSEGNGYVCVMMTEIV